MSTGRWEVELRRLAQHLAEQRRAIRSGDLAALEAFAPEPDLGPLPRALARRAHELQDESTALQQLLQEALDTTAAALAAGPLRSPSDGSPAFLDSRV